MLCSQKYHISICVLVAASLLASVKAQISCLNNGNYTSNSKYQTNLNTLLISNLSTNVDQYGFYNASVGQDPDRATAIVLCSGDAQLDVCRSCIQKATVQILQACPNQMQAILWDVDGACMLRYSNVYFVGTLDYQQPGWNYWNSPNSTKPNEFMSNVLKLLENITINASAGGSLLKVAYGSMPTVGNQTIYAIEQCTPDLSQKDCYTCLTTTVKRTDRVMFATTSGRLLRATCNIHYDISPIYNETRLQELLSTSMPPPPGSSPTPVASPSGNGNNNDSNTTRTIIISVSTIAGTIIIILIGFLLWRINHKMPKEESGIIEGVDEISIIESLQYEFSVIQSATSNFSEANKLGQGGFGAVYKGKLSNGQEIAVKRLSRDSGQGDLEFKNEVMLLAKLQHRNLVRLFGFSIDGQEKLLVYEFVKNASLDQFLFDSTKRSQLNWDTRYKIIGGIARGILYLHEDSRLRIIHRDLKASNVLLDGEMNPKIADFGMAKLFRPDETQDATSRIVGTYGYMAPEYATQGYFSVKSDVFSFGVLFLEIISGKKNTSFWHGEKQEGLISSVWENWNNGTAANLVDPALGAGLSIPRDILRCIHIALLCVQETAAQRPTMASVVTMLNSCSISLPVPSSPTSYVYNGHESESSLLQEFNSREGNFRNLLKSEGTELSDSASLNEMSISEFVAR